jgi:pimeloyl-ACP methyl ester carboxylesterase
MRVLMCRLFNWLLLLAVLAANGCGTFVARRIAEAPNSYPSWLAPRAHVFLSFDDKFLTNFPAQFVDVGPPPARLHYRVVSPAAYHLAVTSTNWVKAGKTNVRFTFRADVPGRTNAWTTAPRGTVVLLHGYGLAEFSMAPWALRLGQEGWRCVLVDLRGHGKSTGGKIYFGVRETQDMSQLLDRLAQQGELAPPLAALGESYGAALALRWKVEEPRIESVVAIAPYAVLSNAVLNICHEYAPCLPQFVLRAGLKRLPAVLKVQPDELDTTTVLARHLVTALFVAGSGDKVIPPADVRKLFAEGAPNSQLVVISGATHETVPYDFSELLPLTLAWLNANAPPRNNPSP